MTRPTTTTLTFPASWRTDSRERFQRLADAGRVDQADVDDIEAKLEWFRAWRNYYAETGGKDEPLQKASGL